MLIYPAYYLVTVLSIYRGRDGDARTDLPEIDLDSNENAGSTHTCIGDNIPHRALSRPEPADSCTLAVSAPTWPGTRQRRSPGTAIDSTPKQAVNI